MVTITGASGSGDEVPPVGSAPSGWGRSGCPECDWLKGEFTRALRSVDRGEGERVTAARGLHLYAAHWGPWSA